MNNHTENTDFGIKLSGELNGVDADTFIEILGNLSIAIHEVNDEIQSNKSLEITIKHIEPGCYDIFLSIKETFLNLLASHIHHSDPITIAAEIVMLIASLICIKQFLKGDKPKQIKQSGRKTILINGDGNKLEIDSRTFNIHVNNQVIDTALSKSFKALKENDPINKFEVYDNTKKPLCSISKEEFEAMAKPSALTQDTTKEKTEEAILAIFKVVFEKGYRWQFYYHGNKISASIEDENFYKDIDAGIHFAKGDTLIVDLLIKMIFDKALQTYIHEDYIVKKIKHHIPRGQQNALPLNSSGNVNKSE